MGLDMPRAPRVIWYLKGVRAIEVGQIYVLSGPSGAGKTTFLQQLTAISAPSDLRLLPRYTDRPPRDGEREGFEYYYTTHAGFLQKVFANDFIHIEKWGDYYNGIEAWLIEETLEAEYDGMILASTFGAARLRATYGRHITPLYLWTGDRVSLVNPRCMSHDGQEVVELKWRIRKKLIEDGFSEYERSSLTDDAFLNKRMAENFVDIAAVNGRLRSGEDIKVIANLHDQLDRSVEQFQYTRSRTGRLPIERSRRRGGGCFVLMPFRDTLRPVYDDHISSVCVSLGVSVTRADQIFSVRPIMDDIREAVLTARFVIADLTDFNPNVLYEVGICHALGKDVILITQDETVPFDLSHIRRIKYEFTPRGMRHFEEQLRSTLRTLLDA
jgi:guanylate kinase